MPREDPFFTKCCLCIPLKSCLHVWSFTKWVVDLAIAGYLTLMEMFLIGYHELEANCFNLAHTFLILIAVLIVDSILMIVLTVGLCANNLRTLRVYFYYSIFMAFFGAVCFIGFLIYAFSELVGIPSTEILISVLAICLFFNSALDVFIIFTLKSEMIKIRNKQQFEFVQMPTLSTEEEREPPEPFQADAENVDV